MEVFTRFGEAYAYKKEPRAIPVRGHGRSASPKDAKVYVIHHHSRLTENNKT
jgi:hypothetical protein